MTTDSVSPQLIGQRLADARRLRSIKQDEAANAIGVSRPTFIAIEKGERKATAPEIVKLASLYGQPVNHFVRSREPVTDFRVHFRVAMEKVTHVDAEQLKAAIQEFKDFVENYVDLEQRMKSPLLMNYPQPVELNRRVNVTELAEDVANRERQRLGLGDQPIPHIRSLLESDVGVRIFSARLPRMIAGMHIFLDSVGGCILINSIHPVDRQRITIAHEYSHLIIDRHTAGIDSLTVVGRKPANERFADSFAMGFLMPASSVRFRFNEIVNSTGNFQVGDLVKLKHFYSVSMEAIALRLEDLGLLRLGTWKSLKEEKLPTHEAEKRMGLVSEPRAETAYPERYKLLAVHAYERGELTEKELANYLRCDIWEARQIIQESILSVEVDTEGQTHRMQTNFETSLLADYA